jgi:hypothetical protein
LYLAIIVVVVWGVEDGELMRAGHDEAEHWRNNRNFGSLRRDAACSAGSGGIHGVSQEDAAEGREAGDLERKDQSQWEFHVSLGSAGMG